MMNSTKSMMCITHRDCRKCGNRVTDLKKTKCDQCGGYLYMIGQSYAPKVKRGR